jgi:lysophospholipase L1-like esterase
MPIPGGSRYVAMGSSFAAGPGLPSRAPGSPRRAGRSTGNYAHLIARALGLDLHDVTFSGATTSDILGPSAAGRAAQLDAVTPETSLVTITAGGNDVGFVPRLPPKRPLVPPAGHTSPPRPRPPVTMPGPRRRGRDASTCPCAEERRTTRTRPAWRRSPNSSSPRWPRTAEVGDTLVRLKPGRARLHHETRRPAVIPVRYRACRIGLGHPAVAAGAMEQRERSSHGRGAALDPKEML